MIECRTAFRDQQMRSVSQLRYNRGTFRLGGSFLDTSDACHA